MARHVLRLRGLVLRYVKALLALLTTALAVYAGDAIVAGLDAGRGDDDVGSYRARGGRADLGADRGARRDLSRRWIEKLMRDDGAPSTAVADDPDLTYVERVSLRIAAIGWLGRSVRDDRVGDDRRHRRAGAGHGARRARRLLDRRGRRGVLRPIPKPDADPVSTMRGGRSHGIERLFAGNACRTAVRQLH